MVNADSVAIGKDIPSGVIDRHRTDIGGIVDDAVTRTVEFGFKRRHNHLAGFLAGSIEGETGMFVAIRARHETHGNHARGIVG